MNFLSSTTYIHFCSSLINLFIYLNKRKDQCYVTLSKEFCNRGRGLFEETASHSSITNFLNIQPIFQKLDSFEDWLKLEGDFSFHSWATEATLLKNPSLNMAVYLVDTDMDEIELENFFGSIREDEPGILDQAFCPDS